MYGELPIQIQQLADKNFELMKADPNRALGFDDEGAILWFWIGSHSAYDKIMP